MNSHGLGRASVVQATWLVIQFHSVPRVQLPVPTDFTACHPPISLPISCQPTVNLLHCRDFVHPQNMIIRYYYNIMRKHFFKKVYSICKNQFFMFIKYAWFAWWMVMGADPP